jgi:hypothetical protein
MKGTLYSKLIKPLGARHKVERLPEPTWQKKVAVPPATSGILTYQTLFEHTTSTAVLTKKGFGRAVDMTKENFKTLGPLLDAVNNFIGEAARRKAAGELDDGSHAAECARARVFIYLHGQISIMFQQAQNSKDFPSLASVQAATFFLIRTAKSGNITSTTTYPDKNQYGELYDAVVQDRLSSATTLFQDASKMLGAAPQTLKVEVQAPLYPAAK